MNFQPSWCRLCESSERLTAECDHLAICRDAAIQRRVFLGSFTSLVVSVPVVALGGFQSSHWSAMLKRKSMLQACRFNEPELRSTTDE